MVQKFRCFCSSYESQGIHCVKDLHPGFHQIVQWRGVSAGDNVRGIFREGKILAHLQCWYGAIRRGKLQHPNFQKMRPYLHSNQVHKHARRQPTSHFQASKMNAADNSATIPGYCYQRGCTRSRRYPKLRKKISWENFGTKLKNKIISMNWSPDDPHPPCTDRISKYLHTMFECSRFKPKWTAKPCLVKGAFLAKESWSPRSDPTPPHHHTPHNTLCPEMARSRHKGQLFFPFFFSIGL